MLPGQVGYSGFCDGFLDGFMMFYGRSKVFGCGFPSGFFLFSVLEWFI